MTLPNQESEPTHSKASDTEVCHILWDWNGTLFDDARLCQVIMMEIFQERGLPIPSPEMQEQLFIHPIRDYYKALHVDFELHPFEVLVDMFFKRYKARSSNCTTRQSADFVLDSLQKKGISHSILSAIHEETLSQLTAAVGLSHYFDAQIGASNHHGRGKIDEGKLYLEQLDVKPEGVLLVGDTSHDFEVAESLGVRATLIYSGYESKERLERSGAPVISCLTELLQKF